MRIQPDNGQMFHIVMPAQKYDSTTTFEILTQDGRSLAQVTIQVPVDDQPKIVVEPRNAAVTVGHPAILASAAE